MSALGTSGRALALAVVQVEPLDMVSRVRRGEWPPMSTDTKKLGGPTELLPRGHCRVARPRG